MHVPNELWNKLEKFLKVQHAGYLTETQISNVTSSIVALIRDNDELMEDILMELETVVMPEEPSVN